MLWRSHFFWCKISRWWFSTEAWPKNLLWTFSQIWTTSSLTRVFTKCLLKRFQTGSPTAIPPLDLRNTQPKIAFVMLTLFACEWFIRWNEQMVAWVYTFGSTTHPFNWKIQKRRKQGKVFSSPTKVIYTCIYIYITLRRFVDIARLYTTAPQILNGKRSFDGLLTNLP